MELEKRLERFAFLQENSLLGHSLGQWIAFLGIATALIALSYPLRNPVLSRSFDRLAAHTAKPWWCLPKRLLESTRNWLVIPICLLIAANSLNLTDKIDRSLGRLLSALVLVQIGFWVNTAIAVGVEILSPREDSAASQAVAPGTLILSLLARIFAIGLIAVMILDNMGIDVRTLIAGLGIGGVAVALALQNILSDLFASLSIALDKPFRIGDSINVDTFNGTIEKIGLKTTRLRSLTGEQIVISNNNLLNSRIRNYAIMPDRRVESILELSSKTTTEQLERAPRIVAEVIRANPDLIFDRAHVKSVKDNGNFTLEYVYRVRKSDYELYMDCNQAALIAILRAFGREGIKIGSPPPSVTIERRAADPSPI